MKIGKLEIKSECGLCHEDIGQLKYAIRDSFEEKYNQWLLRHVKSALSFGFYRPNPKKFIPVCELCVNQIKELK